MYAINHLPTYDISTSTTGCCAVFNPTEWEDNSFQFDNKLFVKMKVRNAFHIPLNMSSAMRKTQAAVKEANAETDEYVMLSHDNSPWSGEHLLAVTKEVPGLESVRLSGEYLTKVFEGPYKNIGKWDAELTQFAESKGRTPIKNYFYYTTCPSCAKEYSKNYVVGFVQVEM